MAHEGTVAGPAESANPTNRTTAATCPVTTICAGLAAAGIAAFGARPLAHTKASTCPPTIIVTTRAWQMSMLYLRAGPMVFGLPSRERRSLCRPGRHSPAIREHRGSAPSEEVDLCHCPIDSMAREPLLATLAAARARWPLRERRATGPSAPCRSGRGNPHRLFVLGLSRPLPASPGFSLHAATRVEATDRDGLERLNQPPKHSISGKSQIEPTPSSIRRGQASATPPALPRQSDSH